LPWVKARRGAAVDAARRSIRSARGAIKRLALMNPMKQIDALNLDGHLLQTLLAVVEEGSVTRAAERLGVTQSAVSHQLDRLRAIVGDALFVKSGRGIVPTDHAQTLAGRARLLLDEMRSFARSVRFDPAVVTMTLTIAANDLQRDLLLPAFLHRVRRQAPAVRLRVVPSGAPRPELLRDGDCQLVVTPRPPDATDLLHTRLLEDRYVVFYDADERDAPTTLATYLAAEHVTVVHEPRRTLEIDDLLAGQGLHRRFAVEVPAFSGVAPFLRGSTHLATLPRLLSTHLLRGFAMAEVPVPCPTMPMFMVWHRRHQDDPLHRWLRAELQAEVAPALARAGAA
jgi:DNA-binding transcriptional LysR family regulator